MTDGPHHEMARRAHVTGQGTSPDDRLGLEIRDTTREPTVCESTEFPATHLHATEEALGITFEPSEMVDYRRIPATHPVEIRALGCVVTGQVSVIQVEERLPIIWVDVREKGGCDG